MCDIICMLWKCLRLTSSAKCNLLMFKCLDVKAAYAQIIENTLFKKSCFFVMCCSSDSCLDRINRRCFLKTTIHHRNTGHYRPQKCSIYCISIVLDSITMYRCCLYCVHLLCVLLFNCLSAVIKSILFAAESTASVIASFGDEEGAKVLSNNHRIKVKCKK